MTSSPPLFRRDDVRDRLALALDFPSADEALRMVEELHDELRWVKVGMQLFTAEGPSLVQRLRRDGLKVFLDLKFHDIPATMAGAVASAAAMGASLCTVHAAAGRGVAAAAEAGARHNPPVGVLAVTVLTSFEEGELQRLLGGREKLRAEGTLGRWWAQKPHSTAHLVQRLARAAIREGATGLVSSPQEVRALRRKLGGDPLLVTPGIRPGGSDSQDQRRVATPASALQAGADLLVIGRPLTRAAAPVAALRAILEEMAHA